jgi:hypothetical protein
MVKYYNTGEVANITATQESKKPTELCSIDDFDKIPPKKIFNNLYIYRIAVEKIDYTRYWVEYTRKCELQWERIDCYFLKLETAKQKYLA